MDGERTPRRTGGNGGQRARNVTINLRANHRQRALIDHAAAATGKTRSEFMLEAACNAAGAALSDRNVFALDAASYARFTALLDAPPSANIRLRRLLSRRAPWER